MDLKQIISLTEKVKQDMEASLPDLSSEIDFLLKGLGECESLFYSLIEDERQKYISMAIFLTI